MTIAENIAYAQDSFSMDAIIEVANKVNIHNFVQQLPEVSEEKIALSIHKHCFFSLRVTTREWV